MKSSTEKKVEPIEADAPAARTYCTFRLEGGLFGIDALAVKEIAVLPPITPIPHAPDAVRGCVNLRGQIVLVLDANALLRIGETAIDSATRLIVFRASMGDPFGILADRIGDIVELSDEEIEKREFDAISRENTSASPREDLIAGIGKLDGELLTILDGGQLLPHVEAVIEQCVKKAYY